MEVIKATGPEVLKTAPQLKSICITLRLPNNEHYGRIGLSSHKILWSFASIHWGEKSTKMSILVGLCSLLDWTISTSVL